MARGKTLLKLLDDLRAEAGLSLNPAHNLQKRDTHVMLLQRVQEWLWDDFDWPHLRTEMQRTVDVGQRYLDVPAGLTIERLEQIDVFRDGFWRPLIPSIGAQNFSAYNSDLGERDWPIRSWRLAINGSDQIEVWPIPSTAANAVTRDGYLKFTGIRTLRPLVDDDDQADLDDRLIVLFAAAELLQSAGDKAAGYKLGQATSRYGRLRGDLSKRTRFQMFGVARAPRDTREYVTNYQPPRIIPSG